MLLLSPLTSKRKRGELLQPLLPRTQGWGQQGRMATTSKGRVGEQ